MDAAAFLSVLRRRWLAVAACLIAGIVGAISLTRSTPETYRATARLFVNIPASRSVQESVQGVQLSSQLLESYAALATSRSAAGQVAAKLAGDVPPDAIRGKLAARPVPNTLIMLVSAVDTNPLRAQELANASALVFIDLVADLEKGKAGAIEPRIIDRAARPSVPFNPKPQKNLLLGGILGLGAGLALAALLEALDRSIRTPHEASELLGAPLLGIVPKRRDVKDKPLVADEDAGTPAAESYRVIRTAVRFVDLDRPIRTLVVTSPSPGDGKTMTAANLALTLAQGGERVVLVDADLRRSRLPEMLGVPASPGLTSVVIGQAAGSDVLRPIADRLALLPPGPLPPNPSELLGSQQMAEIIRNLGDIADVVIFDAPPVLAVTDAAVLATQCDGVIVVARHGRTQRALAAETRRRLDVVGARVVGVVLNGVPASADYTDEYRYTRYYTDATPKGRGGRFRRNRADAPAEL